MSDHLHRALLGLERKLLEHAERVERHVEHMERADRRSEIRDRNSEIRLERIEAFERAQVGLLREILHELRRQRPRTFPATSGVSIRPYPGGQ